MGLFARDKNQPGGDVTRTPPMPPGRRLRSDLSPEDCVEVLRQVFDGYRPRRRPDMEPLVPAGIHWAAEDGPPSIALSGSDESDDFVLFTFAPARQGTDAGIFTLGGNLAVAGHWKQRDSSLTSVGAWPGGTVYLTPPPIDESLVYGTLAAAGYPATPGNVSKVAQQFTTMFLVKCQGFVSLKEGPRGAERFMMTHQRWQQQQGSPSLAELLQAPLRLLAEWNTGVLPYVQDLPMRIRSILLEAAGDDRDGLWSKLEK